MRRIFLRFLFFGSVLAGAGCPHPAQRSPNGPGRAQVEVELSDFTRYWLGPSLVAPPTLGSPEAEVEVGGLEGLAAWVSVEDSAWNQWPGYGSRLFNGRQYLVFSVTVLGDRPLRWVPERSRLEVNEAGAGLAAVAHPDELLTPLMVGALEQQRWHLEGDLAERVRGAGALRAAYLPTAEQGGALHGLVAFPAPADEAQIAAMRLTLRVMSGGVPTDVVWLLE
ncbi:MAG: hypothetical protein JXX28_16805 [Deltaproteobacteria bacterium]|nr:hypothetical protein [Deltaproteobacteria bacterium]